MKSFIEKKDLIVGQMRYFAQHLGIAEGSKKSKVEETVDAGGNDIIDI